MTEATQNNNMTLSKRERVEWVDIARFLGIFTVYLAHYILLAGHAYAIAFRFAMQMFFLISGCMNIYDHENNFFKYTLKKAKTILLPFYGFGLLSIALNSIAFNSDILTIRRDIVVILKGCVRNKDNFYAGALWFFSCLFLMEIIFKLIKYLKFKPIIIAISLGLYVVTQTLIKPNPATEPHMLYNLDSALYYLIFFAIGYCIYPILLEFLKLDTKIKKIIFTVLFLLSAGYTLLVFLEIDILEMLFGNISIVMMFVPIIKALIIILFNILLAKLLCGIKLLVDLGRDTLYLCGNEYVVKSTMLYVIELFGLKLTMTNHLMVYIYVFILLIVNHKVIIPVEKAIIKNIKKILFFS